MRSVFLLGSGASRDAGMPSVQAITQQVLSGEGVSLDTAQRFHIQDIDHPNYELYRPRAEPVLAFVDEMRSLSEKYFHREPNYEEISSLAGQLHDALTGEYESAATLPLIAELLGRPYISGDQNELCALTRLAQDYIADTVHRMLDKPPASLEHLGAVITACRTLPNVDLATLNHDLVIERALEQQDIPYADGFEQTDDDIRRWEDEWSGSRVSLIKLHGSIDWWAYQFAGEAGRGWITTRVRCADIDHPQRAGIDGPPHPRPIFLTGTFDKILSYESWSFSDAHFRFNAGLREARRVVVIGYGFGDKAINARLVRWLARSRENKLVVCHPDPDALWRHQARPAICQGRLKVDPSAPVEN